MKIIKIKGAREHNLKNIDIELPRDKFIVITGLSGSGKSTLAFDTIYAEGQRRYMESLSSYARHFLGMLNKPDVDLIEGLSPAISIEQKSAGKNPRSTVGTITEIHDYLRLLYARVGTLYCPNDKTRIEAASAEKIAKYIVHDFQDKDVIILAPVIRAQKGRHEKVLSSLYKDGYLRARVNGEIVRCDEDIKLERYKMHNIEAVIDRVKTDDFSRINQAVENALKLSKGLVIAYVQKENKEKIYSSLLSCPVCGLTFEELQPRMFSFNSPFGACEKCHGLGINMEFDPSLIIPDLNLSIADGALAIYRNAIDGWRGQYVGGVARHVGFDIFTPLKDITKEQMNILLYGSNDEISFKMITNGGDSSWSHKGRWEGIIPQSKRLYHQTESDYRRRELGKFMRVSPCGACNGKRLKPKVLSVTVGDLSIAELSALSIQECGEFFEKLTLKGKEKKIAEQVLKEIRERLGFLNKVGLGYLTLSRPVSTLSGGEAQRIRLATQIGSNLMGVLYILDEPSIGLHQRDNSRLIETLKDLKDLGNTLIVVEHDEDTIRAADYVVDMGPGAGIEGGSITATGTPKQIEDNKQSLTGDYLSKRKQIEKPTIRRKADNYLKIKGAFANNLKSLNVNIPLNVLTVITGVSGSGKSSLMHEVLYKGLNNYFKGESKPLLKCKSIEYKGLIDKLVLIDQSPIGKTPRSNPATYTKVFDEIRKLFASTKEAKMRGYKPGRFSFNVKGGRCEACKGDGLIKIEMNFLSDVFVECEECRGKRYNKETLEVKYKGYSIADVLNLSVLEALKVFENIPYVKNKLITLSRVGLDYIKLGQSSITLSGGEAQRIKLTKELSKKGGNKTLYLLDEPTTGLHFHDVKKLISVLNSLIDNGSSILIIEHNLDIIKSADYVIDLGPEGGNKGGKLVASGTPEEIVKVKKSFTGQFLKSLF